MRVLAGLFLAIGIWAAPIRVLIVDGVNNHDWRAGTAFIKSTLEKTGRFRVDVSTTPADIESWRPRFRDYRVIVNNFNGGHLKTGIRWPRVVEEEFVAYVRGGGGLVNFHAANNAFLLWPEFNEMTGLLWRDKNFGSGLVVDDQKQVVVVPAGEGPAPGHGPRHDFRVDVLDRKHPVTRTSPEFWMHRSEQLTHGQRGPAEVHVLTYAWSKDSKRNEPMDWWRTYDKGRVYTTMLGHSWKDEPNANYEVPEFQTLIARAVEWAATGKVK